MIKIKIAFTGTPSCGKTTICETLYNLMSSTYTPEVARPYIKSIGREPKGGDQYIIAKMQSELENSIQLQDKFNICEAPVYIPAIYDSLYNKGKDSNRIVNLGKLHTYDVIFNVLDTPKYINDGIRFHTNEEIYKLEQLIDHFNEGQNVIDIHGVDHNKRIEQILDYVM